MSPPALKCRRVGVRTAPPRQIRRLVRSTLDKDRTQDSHVGLEDASMSADSSPAQSFRLARTEARACTRAQTRRACAPADEAGSKDPVGGTWVPFATAALAASAEAFCAAAMALGSADVASLTHMSPLMDQAASRCKVAACARTAARRSVDAGKLVAALSAWMATVSTGCRWMFPAQTRAWHHQVQAERKSACIIVWTMLFGGLAMKGAAHLNFGMMHEAAIPARA